MKDKLQKAKDKVKNKDQSEDVKSKREKAQAQDLDKERQSVLEQGKSYVKPLSLSPQAALKWTGMILAGLIVGLVALFAVLIYVFESDNDIVYGASKVVPYPAECIDGRFMCLLGGDMVRYSDYQFNLRTLKSGSASQLGAENEIDFTTEEGKEQLETFKTLAIIEARQNVALRNIADERDISATREEVDEELENFIESEGGQEQLEEAIEDIYGWTLNDFRRVIELQVLRTKLQQLEADDVLEQVEAEEDFADLAREHSSDGSAPDGGDLGYMDEDSPYVEEFKQAALELEPGEHTGLVETQFGFHIIKATDSDPDEGLRVSHILIDGSELQNMIQERLGEASIRTYIDIETELEDFGAPAPEEQAS